ncbi:glycosyl transferase family 90 [Aliiroseovarius sp.]|uniref:glycosyl transferase family 90 n=1 Tax=Aliiroseovarius sp. TaxID=1872442 RepID=UPI003BA93FB7
MLRRWRASRGQRRQQQPVLPNPSVWSNRPLGVTPEEIAANLTEELRELRPDLPPLRLELDPSLPFFDLMLRRDGDAVRMRAGARPGDRVPTNFIQGRAAAPIWWLLNASESVETLSISLSDGDQPSLADYAFSAFDPARGLLPDSYFFRRRGYLRMRHHALAKAVPWNEREEGVIWRGSVNGQGLYSLLPEMVDHPGVKQRLRLALKARDLDGIDMRFVVGEGTDRAALEAAGLLGDRVPPGGWRRRKFALDVDGYSNAWSNLIERFHLGCCVLKVDSEYGFRQWYYDRLVPFETHVPVKADLSDLEEKLDWIRANDVQCRNIAANGQALARSLDFESQTRWAGETITQRWAG